MSHTVVIDRVIRAGGDPLTLEEVQSGWYDGSQPSMEA